MNREFHPVACLLLVILLSGAFNVVSSPAQNRVLELDGNGSYVELPPNIFKNLTEATVEVWAKWDRFNNYSRVFDFGAKAQSLSVFNHADSPDLRFNVYPKDVREHPKQNFSARANGVLHPNEWIHIAAVSGSGGMKLYADGVLVAMHTNETCLASINTEQMNLFGRGLMQNSHDQDFHGQMDEVRVWNHRRSEEQIRDNMNRRLSGREAGLVGLWNFDDGQATDVSAGAHHGKFVGNARTVLPKLPDGLQLIAGDLVTSSPAKPEIASIAPAQQQDVLYWWIAGALTLIVGLLVWMGLMLRRSAAHSPKLVVAPSLLPASGTATKPALLETTSPDVKDRALAELTEFAKQSLVQGLYSQRNALLETQQKAHRELAELEARLGALKLPDRILAYEKRIIELERELDVRTGEVRELTSTTLSLLRRKVEEERELERATRTFN